MRKNGIRGRTSHARRPRTRSIHCPVAPNVATSPRRPRTRCGRPIWPTSGPRRGGCTWRSCLIWFNREVVGWAIKPRMTADIVVDARAMAWVRPTYNPRKLRGSASGTIADRSAKNSPSVRTTQGTDLAPRGGLEPPTCGLTDCRRVSLVQTLTQNSVPQLPRTSHRQSHYHRRSPRNCGTEFGGFSLPRGTAVACTDAAGMPRVTLR
jgi:hypothetical protein